MKCPLIVNHKIKLSDLDYHEKIIAYRAALQAAVERAMKAKQAMIYGKEGVDYYV